MQTDFFSKFARTVVEKAKADVDRTRRLFSGLEQQRSEMGVIDELLSFWNLEEVSPAPRAPSPHAMGRDAHPIRTGWWRDLRPVRTEV